MRLFSKKQSDLPRRRQRAEATIDAQQRESQQFAFQRNRTLMGSASARVQSSASEASHQLKSARVQAHELARTRRNIGGILAIVLLACAVLYILVSQFTASAVVRADDLTLRIDDKTYSNEIEAYLGGQPVERLRFVLNEESLLRYLQAKSPEVESVHVGGAAGFGKSQFIVKLRSPVASWSMSGTRRYVDETGVSFAKNYYSSPSVQIVDNSGIQVDTGEAIASNRFLGFVGQVVGASKKHGYTVTQVSIPRGTTRQIEVKLKGISYPVKFSVDRIVGEQVEDMTRAIAWMKSHGKRPDYLDVRVSRKVYYR